VTGAGDVYDAPAFARGLDVELNSQPQAGALQYLQEEDLNQQQLGSTGGTLSSRQGIRGMRPPFPALFSC
jgi:hypothetical protein